MDRGRNWEEEKKTGEEKDGKFDKGKTFNRNAWKFNGPSSGWMNPSTGNQPYLISLALFLGQQVQGRHNATSVKLQINLNVSIWIHTFGPPPLEAHSRGSLIANNHIYIEIGQATVFSRYLHNCSIKKRKLPSTLFPLVSLIRLLTRNELVI